MTFHGTANGGTHAPGSSRGDGMGKCCSRCKTPYGHSAVAGICCHETKEAGD